KTFFYGYFASGQVPLAAARIHNRSTGTWHCHEHALEKVRLQSEPPPLLEPAMAVVNVLETLPDTDGNGVPDFADLEETHPPRPEQLGLEVLPGLNVLDLVSVDENGFTSWRTIQVFSTAPQGG
ncbi:MAG: hypothetical protein ACRD2T_07470, partial [Thermoanaerobaculia bacterium]